MRSKGRWSSGTFVLGSSVVGTVIQGAGGEWFAYGCSEDWEDVSLRAHRTEEEAKAAVETWVEEHQDFP